MENEKIIEMNKERIFHALILNDETAGKFYATWVYEQKKTIETRMRKFSYSGDLVICCGKTNSVSGHAGKALCIVHFGEGRKMTKEDELGACIKSIEGRIAYPLSNWRYFSKTFNFSSYKVSGTWQGIFKIKIPENIQWYNTQKKGEL